MPPEPMTVDHLWALPRVGAPAPLPDGRACVVPVTTYDLAANAGTTRLWWVDAAGGGAPRPLTAADVSSSQPAVSPDGARLAFVRKPGAPAKAGKNKGAPASPPTGQAAGPARFGEVDQLWVLPLSGGEAVRLTDLPLGVASPVWFPDGRRIAVVVPLYGDAPTVAGSAERHAARDDDPVKAYVTEDRVYRYWDRWLTDGVFHHVFVVDVDSGAVVDVTPSMRRWLYLMPPGNGVAVRPDGGQIAFDACRSEPPFDRVLWGAFTVDVPDDLAAAAVDPARLAPPVLVAPDLGGADGGAAPDRQLEAHRPVYAPDGRWLVYGLQREFDFYADRMRLAALDLASGAHTVLTEGWDVSAGDWTFDPAAPATLWLTGEVGPRNAVWSLDVAAAVAAGGAVPRRRACDGTLSSPAPAGGRVFAAHAALAAPPSAAWFDAADPRADAPVTRIGGFTDAALAGVAFGAVEDVTFAGADDDPVQMFVVYPPGATPPAPDERPARPWPLVHMIHGGPHGTFGDGWHWRWCAHAFAAPGYVVALVNFHGSTGFGEAFTKSILGRWGDRPSRDIEAATDLLVARGVADPTRLAITGGSYGGYLVSWLCGQSDRYACAVNHAGVSDFQTQFATDITQGRQRSMGGELWDDLDGLDRFNPLRQAHGFTTPMLVVHGQRDYRVPYNQGLAIYNVYRARGLPARLVVYPDENHWILKPHNSRHWYGEVLGWLRRWLGPAAVAAALAAGLATAGCAGATAGATTGAGAPSAAPPTAPVAAAPAATLTSDERQALTEAQAGLARGGKVSAAAVATLGAIHGAHPASSEVLPVLQAALIARDDWTGLAAVLAARPALSPAEQSTLAKVYIRLGRWIEAAELARPLSDAAPGDAAAAYAAALPLARLGRLDEAAAVLDRAAEAIRTSAHVDALTLRGMVHLDADEVDDAIAALEQAVALDRDYIPAHNALGRARLLRGDADGSRAAYDAVATLHARNDAATARQLRLSAQATALKAAWDDGDLATARDTIEAMLPEADTADPATQRELWQFAAAIYQALGETELAGQAQARAGEVDAVAP